jgi:hypothetical protein
VTLSKLALHMSKPVVMLVEGFCDPGVIANAAGVIACRFTNAKHVRLLATFVRNQSRESTLLHS